MVFGVETTLGDKIDKDEVTLGVLRYVFNTSKNYAWYYLKRIRSYGYDVTPLNEVDNSSLNFIKLDYDHTRKHGKLYFNDGMNWKKSQVTSMFMVMDKDVQTIQIYVEYVADIQYTKKDGVWVK